MIDRLSDYFYTRLSNGTHSYSIIKRNPAFIGGKDKLSIALNNPVTFACIEIRAKFLSMAKFYIDRGDGEQDFDDPIIKLLEHPNHLQSKQDFLKQYEWFKMAYGYVYQKPIASYGFDIPKAIFNINPAHLTFPDKPIDPLTARKSDTREFDRQQVIYEPKIGDKRTFEFGDLIAFYDIANGLKDVFTSPSRLDAIIKQISNINDAGDAENVILNTNGREMFGGGEAKGSNLGGSIPLDPTDKENIEKKLMGYGLTKGRSRSIAAKIMPAWKSLHIPLKDLGLHESLESNANIVTQAFDVPNEIYKAYREGDTFENKEKAMLSMVQNVAQPEADDLANTYTSTFGLEETPIRASFEHLPIMQATESMKADKALKIATAYRTLAQAGVDSDGINELFQALGINTIE